MRAYVVTGGARGVGHAIAERLSDGGRVITVDVLSLGATHLHAAGADATVTVVGLAPECHLQRALLEDLAHIDPQRAEADVVEAAQRLVTRWPAVREIVLECTNMPSYAKAVARATRRPVHHIISLLHERWRALETDA